LEQDALIRSPKDRGLASKKIATQIPTDTGSISGKVTDSTNSTPLQSIEVDIIDSNGYWTDYGYTDASGDYTVTGLPDGNYFALAYSYQDYASQLYDGINCTGCDPLTGTAISVTGGGITSGIDFALSPGGHISGTITDSANGTPIPNVSVYLFTSTGN